MTRKNPSLVTRLNRSPIENRMIPPRQPVHDQHREKGGEGREKNRQLEHDREKRRHGRPVGRFPVHDQRINEPGRSELQDRRGQQAGNSAAKHHRAEPRLAESHRFIHSVNRKRRMHVPALEAGIAHVLRRFVKRGGARVFRPHSVNLVSGRRSHVRSFPPCRDGAMLAGSHNAGRLRAAQSSLPTSRSSGRKRMKSRKSEVKIPNVPMNVQMSTHVG